MTFEVWLSVGEGAVALTLSWASQPSIIRFALFSFFNNWIWKSNGNKPVVGSDLKWLRLSLMLRWAHSSPWGVAELCLRPSVPFRKDQAFPVVFQILAAIYVGTIGNNSSELNIKAAISAFLAGVSEQDFVKLHRNGVPETAPCLHPCMNLGSALHLQFLV